MVLHCFSGQVESLVQRLFYQPVRSVQAKALDYS